MKRLTIFFFAILFLPTPAPGQEHVFSPGGRVRIEAPSIFDGRLEGLVRDYTHEGLFFEESTSGRSFWVAPTELRYLAKYRGEDRAYMMKRRASSMSFVGGSIGAVAGPFIAIGLNRGDLLTGSMVGAMSGAIVGSVGGLFWGSRHEGDVWREYRIIGRGGHAPVR